MDLSVIIISYNEADFIERALKSCLDQDCQYKFEIIIADDGSTDDSKTIIETNIQKNPNSIKSFFANRDDGVFIPSIRVSNNIKRALAITRGKYIVCLSADDYFSNNSVFKEAIDFLDNSPKYGAAFFDFRRVYSNQKFEQNTYNHFPIRSLMLSKGAYYSHISTFFFRKEVYLNNCLLDRFCDDLGMLYSICYYGKVKHIKKQGFDYVQRENSIMHSQDVAEICIADVMIIQDVFNKGKHRIKFLSRFYTSLIALFNNRHNLDNQKYDKYFADSCLYAHDLLSLIKDYDVIEKKKRIQLRGIFFISKVARLYYGIIKKASDIIYSLCN